MNPADVKSFKILALDGGGMRGLYTATLLDGLSRSFPQTTKGIGQKFDLIVGTSTGGILACALAAGIQPSELVRFYEEWGPKIFRNPVPQTFLGKIKWLLRSRRAAANDPKPLRDALENFFGDQTLGDIWNKHRVALCLPATNMLDESTKVFKTPHIPRLQIDQHFRVVDVCLATSAAPVYLPLAEVYRPGHPGEGVFYADGGLWANNPSLVGLLEALEMCPEGDGSCSKRPIEILSLGTCGIPEGDAPDLKANRGVLDWNAGALTISLSMNAQAAGVEFMTKLLCLRISQLGRPAEVARIKNPPISLKQSKHLGLDLATPTAIKLLKQLGSKRAQEIMSSCADPTSPEGKMVCRIFT